MESTDAERQVKMLKALAEPTRLRIVQLLLNGDRMTGTELSSALGISMALLCHHWKVLEEAGVLEKSRAGQSCYCRLDREAMAHSLGKLLKALTEPPVEA